MYGWLDHWAHRRAEDLIEEAQRHRLARTLRDASRNGRPAGRRSVHELVDLVRGALAGKGVVERPACEECIAK